MEDWLKKVEKEIGSNNFEAFNDEIEGISWTIRDNIVPPLGFPKIKNSTCEIDAFSFHSVKDESLCNEQILHDLNHGANRLLITWEQIPNLELVFKNVLFEHVKTNIAIDNPKDLPAFYAWYQAENPVNLTVETVFDPDTSFSNCVRKIAGFDVYAVGGNCFQELMFIAHELYEVTGSNKNQNIIIEIGVGENMVFEAAKMIALKWLIEAIKKSQLATMEITIRAKLGWRNKSQSSSHTNQIKQTTEALSAIMGGVNELCITPYDFYYSHVPDPFVRRMAVNIAHILREESHLNRFIGIDQGSIVILNIAKTFADRCWENLEKLPNPTESLKQMVAETIRLRNFKAENKTKMDYKPMVGFGSLPYYTY